MVCKQSLDNLCDVIQGQLFNMYGTEFFNQVKELLVSPERYLNKEFHALRASDISVLKSTPEELYWFAEAMEKVDNSIVKVLDYFTPTEVSKYKTYVKSREDVDDLYTLRNAYELAPNQWTCFLSVTDIALMSKHRIIHTDPNLQRQSRNIIGRSDSNEIIKKIYINPKRVDEIEKCLVEEDYAYNTIRLNLIDDGEYKVGYDPKKHTLTIPKGGDCIVIDGNHRRKACEQVYAKYPELRKKFKNRYFQIAFTFYPARLAKRVISQEWNLEKVSPRHISAMKSNFSNEVVDNIIRSDKSERVYADRIATTGINRSSGNSLMVYSDLADATNKFYQSNDFTLKSQATELSDWLIEFYNYLVTVCIDDFVHIKKSRQTRWITHHYVLSFGFIYLSSVLKGQEDWKQKLLKILQYVDWTKNSPIDPSKVTANIINVENYFKEVVNNVDI